MRAKGHYELRDYRSQIRLNEPRFVFRCLAFCMAVIPKSLFSLLALLLIRVFKPSNHYLTYEVIASKHLSAPLLRFLLGPTWHRHIKVLLD